jgi:hypothetical protein
MAAASSLQEATTAAASGLLEDRLTPPPTPEVQLLVSSGGLARDELTFERKIHFVLERKSTNKGKFRLLKNIIIKQIFARRDQKMNNSSQKIK